MIYVNVSAQNFDDLGRHSRGEHEFRPRHSVVPRWRASPLNGPEQLYEARLFDRRRSRVQLVGSNRVRPLVSPYDALDSLSGPREVHAQAAGSRGFD